MGLGPMDFFDPTGDGLGGVLDPFGMKAKKSGVSDANAAIQKAADEFDLRTGNLSYDVNGDMVSKYMSPDVQYRQNAATQGLGQIYGNSGALRSGAAQAGIANANAGIAAQAWNDAFGRAQQANAANNQMQLQRAQSMYDAKTGQAGNSVAQAMNNRGLAGEAAGVFGGIMGGIFGG